MGRLFLIGRFPALHRPFLLASIRAHPFLGRRQKRLLRSRGASVPLPFRFTLLVLLLGELPAPQVSYSPLMWPSTWPRPGPSSASRVSPIVFEERPAQSGLLRKRWLDGQLGGAPASTSDPSPSPGPGSRFPPLVGLVWLTSSGRGLPASASDPPRCSGRSWYPGPCQLILVV